MGKNLNPAQAYDKLAPQFDKVSDRRRPYLNAVERLIISEIPPGSHSLLDVGAGDGTRAARIAQSADISRLVLLEPSAGMRKHWPPDVGGWPIEAQQLAEKQGSFDVITCLWNTLGHIFPADSRVEVLKQCRRLLSPQGRIFVDVNYRYNARHYGLFRTIARLLRDIVRPSVTNGDVPVSWDVNGTLYTTKGHVFTRREFERMAQAAGLVISQQFTVDYGTGKLCRSHLSGNPLYLLRRAASHKPAKPDLESGR